MEKKNLREKKRKEKDTNKEKEHLERRKKQVSQVISHLSGVLRFKSGPGSVEI